MIKIYKIQISMTTMYISTWYKRRMAQPEDTAWNWSTQDVTV